MRTYEYILRECLGRGLRRSRVTKRNEQWLVRCLNAEPWDGRLRYYEPYKAFPLKSPCSGVVWDSAVGTWDSQTKAWDEFDDCSGSGTVWDSATGTWDEQTKTWDEFAEGGTIGYTYASPFPIIFQLERYLVYITEKGKVNELTRDSFGLYELSEVGDLGSEIESVDVYDSGTFYVITAWSGNESVSKVRYPDGSFNNLIDGSNLSACACCYFNGQFLVGGISNGGEVVENSVMWSEIGRWKFDLDSNTSKTSGYAHMRWQGRVAKIKKLGNGVLVYGTNYSTLLHPVSEPMSGYGVTKEFEFGIKNSFYCDGDETIHGFVFNNKWWTIDESGKVTLWGYEEFLEGLDENLKVTYDKFKKRWFIGDSNTCYMFNGVGLCEVFQSVGSVISLEDEGIVGFYKDLGNYDIIVETDFVDFGVRGLKTINVISCGLETVGALYLGVDYKYSYNTPIMIGKWKPTNIRGGSGVFKTAMDFKVKLRIVNSESTPAESYIDYLMNEFQFSDRRFRRGTLGIGGFNASANSA